jgi:hypothetical protein
MDSSSQSIVQHTTMWCLPCLRLAVQGFKPENGEMFEIICMTDTARTDGRCVACVPNRGRICESVRALVDPNELILIKYRPPTPWMEMRVTSSAS